MSTVIKIENLSKQYRLGLIGTNTLKGDLQRWWYTMRGLPDPTLMIGLENSLKNGNKKNEGMDEYIWALKDINLEVQQGEVLGIIGKNGAGKSTLLKILSRVTSPTTGNFKVKGRIASLLEVGTGFHPELTGRENIFLNGAILGMKKAEISAKLDEIVDFAGIAKYIDTPVKRYSSGMYVRLAFAVAAHLDPDILIVDEVLAVGDAEFQKKAIGKMQDISKGLGRTVLFVSHNMSAVEILCTSGLVLEYGLISYKGSAIDSINHYLSFEPSVNSKIIEGIEFCHHDFKITSVLVNNNDTNIVNVIDSTIDIIVEGLVSENKIMSMSAVLYDLRKNRLAIYSPGHVKGDNHRFKQGKFKIKNTIHMPKNMTKGEYFLGIALHQPNIELYLNIPYAVKLNIKGVIGVSGLDFEYKDNGFLILE